MMIKTIPFFIFFSSITHASSLKGTVTDGSSSDPLLGANVFLVGTSFGDAADENGSYTLSNVPSGKYLIRATYIGYTTAEDSIILTPGKDLTYNLEVDELPSIKLKPIDNIKFTEYEVTVTEEEI